MGSGDATKELACMLHCSHFPLPIPTCGLSIDLFIPGCQINSGFPFPVQCRMGSHSGLPTPSCVLSLFMFCFSYFIVYFWFGAFIWRFLPLDTPMARSLYSLRLLSRCHLLLYNYLSHCRHLTEHVSLAYFVFIQLFPSTLHSGRQGFFQL